MPPHMFHEHQKARLTGEERQRMQPADEILARSNVKPGSCVGDLGSGNGYISIPLARAGADVIALDVQKGMLIDLVAWKENGGKIRPVLASLPDIPIKDKVLDHIFMINIFHEIQAKDVLTNECARVLKDNGCMTLVDFQKRATVMGPPMEERIAENNVEAMFPEFKVEARYGLPDYYQFEFRVRRA